MAGPLRKDLSFSFAASLSKVEGGRLVEGVITMPPFYSIGLQ